MQLLKYFLMIEQNIPTALGTQKVGKLLVEYAVPAIIAMTAASLYNMVDSIFIGKGVGPLAISGLAITFPLINLAAAFGSLVGVGASTLLSVKLGQKDYDTAQRILGNVLVLNFIMGGVFMILSLLFLDPILYFFGASENTIGYARDYMEIILYGNIITHVYLGLNAILRSSGHPQKAMYATIATVILNSILDPIFIFVLDWGIRGAAIATIIAQVVALLWQLKFFSNKNAMLHFHRGIFWLRKRIVFDSLAIGMSPFMMNMASCLVVILINQGLQKYGGDMAIGAFGIVNRIAFVIVMIVMGLNQGMQPIAGYNFGARAFDRVSRVLKITIIVATCITTLGFLLSMMFSVPMVSVFTDDQDLINQAARGLRITLCVFPIVGVQMVVSNFFQSIGMPAKAIFLSLTRQLLFLVPLLIILPRYCEQQGVWISMQIADGIASILAFVLLVWQLKKFKKQAGIV